MLVRYWIEEGRLAGGSCPDVQNLESLAAEFDVIISLLEDERQSLYAPEDAPRSMRWYNVPMRDHATPALGQLVAFYDILWGLSQDARVYVHCLAGIGRTGTVAASHLVWRRMGLDEALGRVSGWTEGLFEVEIQRREGEVRDLLERFRRLMLDAGGGA